LSTSTSSEHPTPPGPLCALLSASGVGPRSRQGSAVRGLLQALRYCWKFPCLFLGASRGQDDRHLPYGPWHPYSAAALPDGGTVLLLFGNVEHHHSPLLSVGFGDRPVASSPRPTCRAQPHSLARLRYYQRLLPHGHHQLHTTPRTPSSTTDGLATPRAPGTRRCPEAAHSLSEGLRYRTGAIGSFWSSRTGAMQDPGYGLPRIRLLGR
jgi:hypothetical protein